MTGEVKTGRAVGFTPFAEGYIAAARENLPPEHRDATLADSTLAAMLRDCEAIIQRTGWTVLDQNAGREAWRLRQASTAFYGLLPTSLHLGEDGLIYQEARS